MLWFAFHGTASFGSDRPEIQQAELLRLPFPSPRDVQESERSEEAAVALVSLVDEAMATAREDSKTRSGGEDVFEKLDSLCYRYFGLGDEEVALAEDAVENVIPSVQPHPGASVDLWRPAQRRDREAYARTLAGSMSQWFDEDATINVVLEASNSDLGLLHLRLEDRGGQAPYREREDKAVGEALGRLGAQIGLPLPGNFQLVPDFRMFTGKSLYLVKPLQRRFWLRSAAIADADALAMELHDAAELGRVGDLA